MTGAPVLRVVVVGPTHPLRGGIAHHTTLLGLALARRHEVLVVSPSRGYPRWLYPGRTDRDPSASPLRVPAERILGPLEPWTWWRTARRIRRFRPDLVLVQWWSTFWAPSLAAVAAAVRRPAGWPVAFELHNVLPHEGASRAAAALTRLALRQADGYLVHGASEADRLSALLPRHAARRPISRGVLPCLSIAGPTDRGAARAALGLSDDDAVALFFGFVRPYKGLEHLVDALPEAARRVPGLRLVVAGEFWRPAEVILSRARALGVADRIVVRDAYVPNEEVGAYFSAADVVVIPYVEASQSGVATQAAELGVPVIASRVGGLPDAVDDGVSGLLVPPADPAALADALARVLGDPELRARFADGARRAHARMGWEAAVERVEALAAAVGRRPS